MSLDLGLADAPDAPDPSLSVSFDSDAYYWFCFPFFETLRTRTGQMIDLYDDACFGGNQLEALAATLAAIRAAATDLPDVSSVCIGRQLVRDGPPQPIHAWLNREKLVRLLDELTALVVDARRDGKWIVAFGD